MYRVFLLIKIQVVYCCVNTNHWNRVVKLLIYKRACAFYAYTKNCRGVFLRFCLSSLKEIIGWHRSLTRCLKNYCFANVHFSSHKFSYPRKKLKNIAVWWIFFSFYSFSCINLCIFIFAATLLGVWQNNRALGCQICPVRFSRKIAKNSHCPPSHNCVCSSAFWLEERTPLKNGGSYRDCRPR